MGCPLASLQQQQVANPATRLALCSWNTVVLFLIPFSLSLHNTVFNCWRSNCPMCSTLSMCSSRVVMVHRSSKSLGSTGHQGALEECSGIPCSTIPGRQHHPCKVLGKPWWYLGPLLALVTEWTYEGAAYHFSWDRTNMFQLSGIDFWQRIQEAAAVLAYSSPPPLYYNVCCSEILNSAINNLLYQQHAFALFEMVLWGR